MRTTIFIVFDQWTGRFLLQKGWSLGEEVEAVYCVCLLYTRIALLILFCIYNKVCKKLLNDFF